MNETSDTKRVISPVTLEDVDKAFFEWWNKKLSISLKNENGDFRKIPVVFVSSERWSRAREEGIRDKNGTIILPIIAISRVGISNPSEGGFSRVYADDKKELVYYKKIDKKSSLIKNLQQSKSKSVDAMAPIYEIYTVPVPDHYLLTYEVKIWTSFIKEMNDIIQKYGIELDNKSRRSFRFETPDGFYFVAFQDDDYDDGSNIDEFTDQERVVKKTISFKVSCHILPESDQKQNSIKRYFSQSKLVMNTEVILTKEEFDKKFGKKNE